LGPDGYWATFWDKDSVFYGHVLGFKGLERRAVVLALNEGDSRDRSRERLYVGMSRATDHLVVCGDPEYVRDVAGEATLRKLRGGA
jgi:ATP-dependent exoDNAse (exonuclease V) beta subunit